MEMDEEALKRFIKYQKKGIILTGEEIDILDAYGIDYTKCISVNELISLIERSKDDSNFDDLDWVEANLAEFNYYHNTHK